MKKLSIAFFIITFVLLNSVIAQTEIKYAETIEGVLNFEDEGKSKIAKLNGSKQISKEIKKRLKLKLKKAEKIKVDYDSITFLTIDVLNNMTRYTDNFSNIFLEIKNKSNQALEISKKQNVSLEDLDNLTQLFKEMDELIESFVVASIKLNEKSSVLFEGINKLRVRNSLEQLDKDKNALNQFYSHYFYPLFEEVKKQESLKKARELNLKQAKQNVFNSQDHRFQFINGLLHYNDVLLFNGQKLKDLELKLGSDYIETQKQDDKNFRKIRFKNIPLSINLDNGIAIEFIVHVLPEKNTATTTHFDVIGNHLIKLENYYITKNLESLHGIERKISKDLDRYFSISYFKPIQVFYSNSNDKTIELPDRAFYIYKNSESNIYKVTYSEPLDN